MVPPLSFDPPIDGGIVVGYDGSAGGRAALRWAWQDAAVLGRPLHVVRAWTLSTAAREAGATAGFVPSHAECAAAVRASTLRALDAVRRACPPAGGDGDDGDDGDDAPVTHVHVVHGHAEDVLTAASAHADLVVVGHRGHDVLSLVLGSVTLHVMEHARCPVLVLPDRSPQPARG